jgi:hypothetical protein
MAAGDITVVRGNANSKKGNYYDGTDDYVLHDAQAVARVAAGDTVGTFSAWIFLDDITSTFTVLSAGDNNVVEYMSMNVAAGKLQYKVYQGGAVQSLITETTRSMEARTWHHVVVVNDLAIKKMYVDGAVVAQTNTTTTDADAWYDIITGGDKFAIGVLEMNGTHTQDFKGAIGQVKYWSIALTPEQIAIEYDDDQSHSTAEQTILDAALQFNITYENDGITDSGLGADNGTLTGHAVYGGEISDWSWKLNSYCTATGHAAEFINTFIDGSDYVSVLKKGD